MPSARAKAKTPVRPTWSRLSETRSSGLGETGPRAGDRLVDASLAGCLLLVPLLMAGRHPLGQAVLIALAVTAAAAWCLGQAWRPSAPFRATCLAPILLLAVGLVALEIVPLSGPFLDEISPKIGALLPLWHSEPVGNALRGVPGSGVAAPVADPRNATEGAGYSQHPGIRPGRLGTWQTISLTPAATRDGLMVLSAYVLLFFVTVQRARRVEDVERLLRWCAAAAAITAVYGLVQCVTANGKFFWFYEHPYANTLDGAKANFTNRNHFAHFLALGLGPLLWWVQSAFAQTSEVSKTSQVFGARRPNELKAYCLAVAVGLVLFAGLLSLSRGGIAAIALAAGLTTALCWRTWTRNKGLLAMLAGAGVLVALALNIFGLNRVSGRVDDLESCSVQRLDREASRRSIWTAVVRSIRDFPLLGTGVGSHAEVYPIHYSPELCEAETEFTHAESSYLQIGLETGLAGLALVAGAVGCCAFWCVGGLMRARSARIAACLGAVTGSLAATATHAIVDFVWYVPACMVMIVILAACAARLWEHACGARFQRARHVENVPHRLAYLAAAAILLPAGAWIIQSQAQSALGEPAWDAYRISRMALDKELERTPEAVPDPAHRARAQEAEQCRIELLETVLRWRPDLARAHLDLAECYLRQFDRIQAVSENPMSLGNVRDAAIRSRFPTREALDAWLHRAVGEHARYLDMALRHVHRALALCPLEGRGYLYLAELCFLENGGTGCKQAYIDQALRVRPFDGEVLSAAATEALLAGDDDRWLDLARRSFQSGRRQRRKLIADLVGRAPPDGLEDVIQMFVREFHPDLESLGNLCATAQTRARPEQLQWLRWYTAQQAEAKARSSRAEAAAPLWNEARGLYAAIGDKARACQCAKRAAAADPQNFDARYGLALALLEQGQDVEAESHLRWCLQRRPNDAAVEARWKEARKAQMDRQVGENNIPQTATAGFTPAER